MEWHDDLAAALPAPREDEPPDLRRKIIAELRDHLHTAVQRELLLTGDAAQAQQRILARFGDPARLARKLWFDAMWEKIMIQRWMLVALVAVVLVSVGSMGLTWFMVVQAGQVNQALLEQNRAMNETLLARLQALGSSPGDAGKSMEWNSLQVRLTLDKPDGAPAAGYKVALAGRLLDTSVPTSLDRTTGPDGVADFGLVRPGQHLLNIQTPWDETIEDTNSMGFFEISGLVITVSPGEPQRHNLVCPSKPEETEISVAVEWPAELSGRPLWLVCDFLLAPREVGGHKWARSENKPKYLVIDPSGKLSNPAMRVFWNESVRDVKFFSQGESFIREGESVHYVQESRSFVDAPGIYRFNKPQTRSSPLPVIDHLVPAYLWLPQSAAMARLKWPAGSYSVSHIAIGCDSQTPDPSLPDDVLHPEFLGGIEIAIDERSGDDLLYPDERQAHASRRKRRKVKTEIPRFEAAPGRLNEWRLSIPARLVELLTEPKVKAEADTPPEENELPPAPSEPSDATQ